MKILLGKVINLKSNKTILVLVKKHYKIPIYNKISINYKKYCVHDELNLCSKNDYVYIFKTRPLSKKKFWKVLKIF